MERQGRKSAFDHKRHFAELREAVLVAHATSLNTSEADAAGSAVQLIRSIRQRKAIAEYSGKASKRRRNDRKEVRERQRLYRQLLLPV